MRALVFIHPDSSIETAEPVGVRVRLQLEISQAFLFDETHETPEEIEAHVRALNPSFKGHTAQVIEVTDWTHPETIVQE